MKPTQCFDSRGGTDTMYLEVLAPRGPGCGEVVQNSSQSDLAKSDIAGLQKTEELVCNAEVAFQGAGRIFADDREHVLCRVFGAGDRSKEQRCGAKSKKQLRPVRAAMLGSELKGEPCACDPHLAWAGGLEAGPETSEGQHARLCGNRPRLSCCLLPLGLCEATSRAVCLLSTCLGCGI